MWLKAIQQKPEELPIVARGFRVVGEREKDVDEKKQKTKKPHLGFSNYRGFAEQMQKKNKKTSW